MFLMHFREDSVNRIVNCEKSTENLRNLIRYFVSMQKRLVSQSEYSPVKGWHCSAGSASAGERCKNCGDSDTGVKTSPACHHVVKHY